jgi:Xaa-Pro dipeptidase
MVITIEPGLYKQGSLGIRIEDNVLITDIGCESLTSFSRDLTVI